MLSSIPRVHFRWWPRASTPARDSSSPSPGSGLLSLPMESRLMHDGITLVNRRSWLSPNSWRIGNHSCSPSPSLQSTGLIDRFLKMREIRWNRPATKHNCPAVLSSNKLDVPIHLRFGLFRGHLGLELTRSFCSEELGGLRGILEAQCLAGQAPLDWRLGAAWAGCRLGFVILYKEPGVIANL